jgi:Ras GTPase-activating-like protein IQGAP2/3
MSLSTVLMQMDQYIALSKKDSKIQITLNEIYSTHNLLAKHINQLTSDTDPKLGTLLKDLGAPTPLLPRKENTTIDLPLYSRFEMPIAELTSSLDLTHEDILYMETKTVFVQLLRVLPSSTPIARPLNLPKVADAAALLKDPVMVRKGIKAMANLRDLEELNIVDPRDRYNPLAMEIEQELVHLGSQRTKAMDELKSLDGVYNTILEHNAYLRNQLSTYKQYLQNVRLASSGGDKSKGVGSTGFGVTSIGGKARAKKAPKSQLIGPYKYTYSQMERAGIISETNVPDSKYLFSGSG